MNTKRLLIVLLLVVSLSAIFSRCGEIDHNDGKCDICGKTATYSKGDEEYCDEHLKEAVEWYIEQGAD